MHFHFYITCYIQYDYVKLEISHAPTVNDLYTCSLSSIGLEADILQN